MKMIVRNAEFADMKQLGHIMSVSFKTAFRDFVSQQTLDACAQEDTGISSMRGYVPTFGKQRRNAFMIASPLCDR